MSTNSKARRAIIVLVVAAVVGGLIGVGLTAGDPTSAAQARIRLSDAVGWPEHDAVRFEVETWIDDDLLEATRDVVGDGFHDLKASFPRNQAYLDITATADTVSEARRAVDFVVEALVERDDQLTMNPLRATVASATSSLESITVELADATTRAERGEPLADIEQGALIWRAEELEGELEAAQRVLAERSPRIYQIGSTDEVPDQRYRRLRIIGVAAALGAIAAGAVLTLLAARPESASDATTDHDEDRIDEDRVDEDRVDEDSSDERPDRATVGSE